MKFSKYAGTIPALALAAGLGISTDAQAGTLTPEIIWGGGNQNQGFTVVTDGSLELGIRAKRRFDRNDTIGVGIVQDGDDNYLFDSSESTAPAGRAMWSYDWGINSNVDGNGGTLDTFRYEIAIDTDPTVNTAFTTIYNVLDATYYVGDNDTSNGEKKEEELNGTSGPTTDSFNDNITNSNVAQNSVQPHWYTPDPAIAGSGQFTVRLSAFDLSNDVLVSSVSINAIVDSPAPIPVPAALPLLLAGLGGLGLVARRKRKAA